MSLFGALNVSANALTAAQIGLQVTGNNIANAGTPDYVRQELIVTPASTQRRGNVLIGLGVQVVGVVQKIDNFLEAQFRNANSDLQNGATQESTYRELELILGELSETDLSTSLTDFAGGIQDILNQPESAGVRNLAVLQGQKLADDIRRLHGRVSELQDNVNGRIAASSDDINRLLEEVADLNVKIVNIEGGRTSRSDAVGLRDQRLGALNELSQILSINAVEQNDGSVTVFSGGDFLVFDAEVRRVTTAIEEEDGITKARVQIAETAKQVDQSSGELAGLTESRDEILGGFLNQFEDFASKLIFEFNKVYSQGQGLVGFSEVTSEFAVADPDAALDQAGLPFTPENGTFQIKVTNKQSGLTTTHDIIVDLNGLDEDTSLNDLAAAIDDIEGISSGVTPLRRLEIESDSPDVEFSFVGDDSGVLAALGINHFFTGQNAGNISVSEEVRENPALFAASSEGVGADAVNAERLAAFFDTKLDSANGLSITDLYDQLASNTTQASSVSRAVAEGFRVFQQSVEAKRISLSGVNIDEEAINMISYQRAFQASARVVSTISELLDTLVNL